MNNQLTRLRGKLLDMIESIDNGNYDSAFDEQLGDKRLCSFRVMVEDIPGEMSRQFYLCPDNIDEVIAQLNALSRGFPFAAKSEGEF